MIWEYRVETIGDLDPPPYARHEKILENLLNELGEVGWELVGTIPRTRQGYTEGATLFFKRGRGG